MTGHAAIAGRTGINARAVLEAMTEGGRRLTSAAGAVVTERQRPAVAAPVAVRHEPASAGSRRQDRASELSVVVRRAASVHVGNARVRSVLVESVHGEVTSQVIGAGMPASDALRRDADSGMSVRTAGACDPPKTVVALVLDRRRAVQEWNVPADRSGLIAAR